MRSIANISSGLALSALSLVAAADDLAAAIRDGKTSLDLRARYEAVSEDNALRDAEALTTRLRLGFTTRALHGFTALVEYEGVFASGGQQFNSSPGVLAASNGNSQASLIPDPTGSEINRAQIEYASSDGLLVRIGRQRIVLDDARFVGNVGWRQDEQSFDALRAQYRPMADVTLDYSYLWQQNFIFFNHNRLNAHLLNASWAPNAGIKLSGFAYLVDFQNEAGAPPRVPGAPDAATWGLIVAGQLQQLSYRASAARQNDHADAPSSVQADYLSATLSYSVAGLTPSVGYERLSGDGTYAFQTPFGTNHKFQGFADVFVAAIPAFGVEDVFLGLGGNIAAIKLTARYHQFRSVQGSRKLGAELDFSAACSLPGGLGLLAKFADYRAHSHAVDTQRLWLQLAYAL